MLDSYTRLTIRYTRQSDMLDNPMPRVNIIEHQGQVGDCRSAWRRERVLYGTAFGESDMITTEDGITIWHVKKASPSGFIGSIQ
jgi:hypothetical protein